MCQAEELREQRAERGGKCAGGHAIVCSGGSVEADEAREMGGQGSGGLYTPKEASSYPVGVMGPTKVLRREGSHDMYILECSLWGWEEYA